MTGSERKLAEWRRIKVIDVAARELCRGPFTVADFCRCWSVILDTLEAHGVDRQRRACQANLPGVSEDPFGEGLPDAGVADYHGNRKRI